MSTASVAIGVLFDQIQTKSVLLVTGDGTVQRILTGVVDGSHIAVADVFNEGRFI